MKTKINKLNIFNIIVLFIILIFTESCSDKKVTNILPVANFDRGLSIDTINSNSDEYSVYQRPSLDSCVDCFNKEFTDKKVEKVKSNRDFFNNMFDSSFVSRNRKELDYITKHIQNVQFLSNKTGFVSIAHNGDSTFNKLFELPFNRSEGGTDIFSFEYNETTKSIEYDVLPKPINSIFWDSHPAAMQDSNCNLVLVWSSDRESPFTEVKNLKGQNIKSGHTDLYYAFYKDKKWSDAKILDTSGVINTPKNEISPFLICNVAPKLFYSSNSVGNNYDIYMAELNINFENSEITIKESPILLNKGRDTSITEKFINTEFDEKFPYIKLPLNERNTQTILFSSNRSQTPISVNQFGDTLIVNKGGFDIYSMAVDFECKAPAPPPPPPPAVVKVETIKYKLNLIDKLNPNREILEPIIKVKNITTNKETIYNLSNIDIELDPNSEYQIMAGSNYELTTCEDLFNNNIQYYNAKKEIELKPIITPRREIVKYDSIVSPHKIVKYDTLRTKELVPVDGLSQLNNLPNTKEIVEPKNNHQIVNTQVATIEKNTVIEAIKPVDTMLVSYKLCCDTKQDKKVIQKPKFGFKKELVRQPNIKEKLVNAVEVTKLTITKNEWYEGKDTVTKDRIIIYYDTTYNTESSIIKINGANSRTKLTMLANIKTDKLNQNATIGRNNYKNQINDTLYLIPEEYSMPECNFSFDSDKIEYYKNVPYFQTAFWEVNTSENLKRHRQELQRDGRLGKATCIDLNFQNSRFGYGRPSINVNGKNINRDTITKNYEYYANEVDKNLKRMADTITKQFMGNLYIFKKVNRKAKLFITMEAFSDKRGAGVCDYIGPDVKFNNLIFKSDLTTPQLIEVKPEKVNNRFSLGTDNENLSLLRAYYGFKELLNILMKNKEFRELYKVGKVYDPTNDYKTDEIMKKIEECDIIFTTYGKGIDQTDAKNNVTEYDKVRRLNLKIEILEYENGKVSTNSCCR